MNDRKFIIQSLDRINKIYKTNSSSPSRSRGSQIGDQKIDVIFAMPDDERSIVREARREMVRL